MVRFLRYILISLLLCSGVNSLAQSTDTATGIFAPTFHTLQTLLNGSDQLPPVITLGGNDELTISFDELASDRRYMRYELLHCDATWRRDALLPSEYIDGFNEGEVEIYRFSEATLVQYVHYEIILPNPRMAIKLSGNYLLRVYDETSPDETLLQVRFCVVEPLMTASASVTSRTDIDYNEAHQQLTIGVDTKGQRLNNVMNDVIVSVEQNGRTDNTVTLTRPTRIAGSIAWWEHVPALIFPAGNEYRRMETVSVTYPGMGVERIVYADPCYHAELLVDYPRNELPYSFDSTQKGRFRIREFNSDDSDVEADYLLTHFALEQPELQGLDIFLDGDFTQRRFGPESLMVYNRATGRYEATVLLKQGAYNYQYLAVGRGSMRGDASVIEGNRYQTSNEYIIKIYLREPGSRYDRLVGVTSVTAGI